MMKKTNYLALALVLLFVNGCATQRFVFDDNANAYPKRKDSSDFFLGGIAQSDSVSAEDICGVNNVAAIETEQTPVNWILSALTGGLYTPREYRIYCKKAPVKTR